MITQSDLTNVQIFRTNAIVQRLTVMKLYFYVRTKEEGGVCHEPAAAGEPGAGDVHPGHHGGP